ncbi:MAG: FAD-binding protein [Verrucomicrobiales bacterium]|nr:FAD-binding protein [Verrucomicrobiales bacterium]
MRPVRAAAALKRLAASLPEGELRFDEATRTAHAGDKWFASALPDAVAIPATTKSVARILSFAHHHRLPITPRGAGHGYVGGCVPIRGGLVLALDQLNRIKEISAADFVAVVEPGVRTLALQMAVEKQGLFYPPDPASRADCSLGGNIATNAGGPRCLKYGVTRDYVLGLEVVLADGRILRLGSRTHKNKTGFELARMFVGSEGLLGVVTEATLKLLPRPPWRACLATGLPTMAAAAATIRKIFASGFLPCAVEVADRFTLKAARQRTGDRRLEGCGAVLIVELDGHEASVRGELKALDRLLKEAKPRFVQRAYGPENTERLWQLRREFSYALRDTGLTKMNEDVVVPRGRLEDLFRLGSRIQRRHGFPVACFGHAGDGNIHVNIMVDESRPGYARRRDAALDELFSGVLALGGVITGEHGIGLAKKPWWRDAVPSEVRALHATLKQALDPNGVLNPGKFV